MSSLISGFEYDIFISYRQKDNKYDGCVTEFVDNLKKELEATFKEEISLYFDINPHDGLLETHDVNASLKEKLKCLVFIPIISRTYCDPKSFAWEHEFKAFVEQASQDQFGLKVKLPGGNVANRILPVRIHDLDKLDIEQFESVLGGFLRSIDFVYKETGVNRQLRAKDDDIIKSPEQILYRDQINKVALAIRDIIESMKARLISEPIKEREIQIDTEEIKQPLFREAYKEYIGKPERKVIIDYSKSKKEKKQLLHLMKLRILVPGILLISSFLLSFIFVLNHRLKVNWAREKILPEIEKSYNELNLAAAFNLLKKAEKYISKYPEFKDWERRVTKKVTIISDPPGADVYIREYSDTAGVWEKVGKTPIDSIKLPQFTFFNHMALPYSSYYLVRFEIAGYEKLIAVTITSQDTLKRKLFREGTVPSGMVYVEGSYDGIANVCIKDNGFFIDRFEVTNRQYKEFVNKGGYRNHEYWKHEFIKEGKNLTWDNAMTEFTDKTGRLGPSTWEAGDYPEGQADYPVSGVSWYEAAAYAEFANKSLPSIDHWQSAAGICYPDYYNNVTIKLFPFSNFNGKGPVPVGSNPGVSCFGTFDMAGNVREWCFNKTEAGNVITGAGYDDANYLFIAWNQLPPFDRSNQNGFRCISFVDKGQVRESTFRVLKMQKGRDFYKEVPVPENTFQIYKNQFSYDSTDLNSKIEERDESPENYIVEKITFNAAYGDDRMIAYLFLPKNTPPPFQTLVFFPGGYALAGNNLKDKSVLNWCFDYILKSGRAIIYPVYIGTYERKDGLPEGMAEPNQTHQYTEWLIKWVKDFKRSVDYLETRQDIDVSKLGFYGHSWGAAFGSVMAVEDRLKVNILIVGGFYHMKSVYPEADDINYVPRIKNPTLMLNGRYDISCPLELDVLPFFDLLGTPAKDKQLYLYETNHYIPKNDMIREVLGWLDKYLGPVK